MPEETQGAANQATSEPVEPVEQPEEGRYREVSSNARPGPAIDGVESQVLGLERDDIVRRAQYQKKAHLLQELEQLRKEEEEQIKEEEELRDLEQEVEAVRKRIRERQEETIQKKPRLSPRVQEKQPLYSPKESDSTAHTQSGTRINNGVSLNSQAAAGNSPAYGRHALPLNSVPAAGSSTAQASASDRLTAKPLIAGSFRKLEGLKYYTKLDEDNGGKLLSFKDMGLGQLRSLLADKEEGRDYTEPAQLTSLLHYFIFLKTDAIEDLESAIDQAREEIPIKDNDRDYAPRLKGLIVMLIKKYQRTNSLGDLQEAIFRAQEMVIATPLNDPDRFARVTDWIGLLLGKVSHTGIQADLDDAVVTAREVGVEVSADNSAYRGSGPMAMKFNVPITSRNISGEVCRSGQNSGQVNFVKFNSSSSFHLGTELVDMVPGEIDATIIRKRSPEAQKYEYQPLPSVGHLRVLHLLPGAKGDELCCDLEAVSIDDAEDTYEAISYVWGDSRHTKVVICSGQRISATTNLADALGAIRDPTETKLVWADAICINQGDDQEKGHQVKRMGRIYQAARRVLVWLGRDTAGIAEDAFTLVHDMNYYLRLQWEQFGGGQFPKLEPPYPYPICSDKSRWAKVDTLLNLPWFNRLWVIQEAGLAKDCVLMWDEHKMAIVEVVEFAFWVGTKGDVVETIGSLSTGKLVGIFGDIQCTYDNTKTWRRSTSYMRHISESADANKPSYFVDILRAGSQAAATDKRDHVYAFLGSPLAQKPDGHLLVEPDYHKSKTVEDVYLETACALLQLPREARWVLASVEHRFEEDVESRHLPSWVPRWDNRKGSACSSLASAIHWYDAGGSYPRRAPTLGDIKGHKFLATNGFIFDHLCWISEHIKFSNWSLDDSEWDYELHSTGQPFIDSLWLNTLKATGLTAAQLEYDFSLTLAMGYGGKKDVDFDMATHLANFAAYRRKARTTVHSNHDQVSIGGNLVGEIGDAHDFWRKAVYCSDRRLFFTDGGRLGLGPYFSRHGDDCCIFPGLPVPFILRRTGDGAYHLVGECYINGVMRGELMDQLREGKFKEETIILV